MNIAKKAYEISIWNDVWEKEGFTEKKIMVIGSNKMKSQNKVFDPIFTTNVNGQKSLSFSIYTKYVDNITGEWVDNPFVQHLFNERKIKLEYKGKIHDFIIKNVVEDSENYVNKYELKDALVQELSKNGFGVVLNEQTGNGIGTIKEIATEILRETDWDVESECIVEKIEEALVYLKLPEDLTGYKITWLKDSDENFLTEGVKEVIPQQDLTGKEILAFYSCCKNKPHRFQFIFLGEEKPNIDEQRIILNKDCQYYIELSPEHYKEEKEIDELEENYGFYLPEGVVVNKKKEASGLLSVISTLYRGARYGYAQKVKYVPLLDRYCQLYKNKEDNALYYGYVDNTYVSPTFITNLVSNTEFSNTAGWIGATKKQGHKKAQIENVFGQFYDDTFISSNDIITQKVKISKSLEEFLGGSSAYLKVIFGDENSLVINDGPYDQRNIIKNLIVDEEYAFKIEAYTENNELVTSIIPKFQECYYNTKTGVYEVSDKNISLKQSETPVNGEYLIYKVEKNNYKNEEIFKKESKLKIILSPIKNSEAIYIKNMEFFRVSYDKDGNVIPLEKQGENANAGVIAQNYKYFKESSLEGLTDPSQIEYSNEEPKLSYEKYIPIYNDGAEKIRTVEGQESNYFNLLQSNAETFEAWLSIEVKRDAKGGVTNKKVCFKNYAGKDNYASFKYGINLKGIQRTHASDSIVTKLIVKQNNNQYGKNGFCTIARAQANPTGENYIYNFGYYQKKGLLNENSYTKLLYEKANPEELNPDKLQGYFLKISEINKEIRNLSETYTNSAMELNTLQAEKFTLEQNIAAATSGIEEVAEDFFNYTNGASFQDYTDGTLKFEIGEVTVNWEGKGDVPNLTVKVEPEILEEKCAVQLIYTIEQIDWTEGEEKEFSIKVTSTLPITFIPTGGTRVLTIIDTIKILPENGYDQTLYSEEKTVVDLTRSEIQECLTQYCVYQNTLLNAQAKLSNEEGIGLESDIAGKKQSFESIKTSIDRLNDQKKELNRLFYKRFSRFIQEGTWISEEYYDDEKYFYDAQSVLYNSCYPQVAYQISVYELSHFPNYEWFNFELGDKTTIEDGEFLGYSEDGAPMRVEIIITEKSENLDNSISDQLKVQNFKNQFQDLFQKITATSQQVQYNSGAYERGAEEARAISENATDFLADALSKMTTNLENPVVSSKSGDTSSELRIVDGKMLLGKKNGDTVEWKTGISADGISAGLITAGEIDTGKISIKNGRDSTFKWDASGITAYDGSYYGGSSSGIDTTKFVRFDKNGIYGINDVSGIDGANWRPTDKNGETAAQEIDKNATFALTWEGLKVTADGGPDTSSTELRIGNNTGASGNSNNILEVKNGQDTTFAITESGSIIWGSGSTPMKALYAKTQLSKPTLRYENYDDSNVENEDGTWTNVWHRIKAVEDYYVSYSYDGGNTWGDALLIQADPAYKITLDDDFASVPNSGNWSVKVKPTIYRSNVQIEAGDTLVIAVEANGLTVSGPSRGEYTVSNLTEESGSAIFILKENGNEVARTAFEAVRNIPGNTPPLCQVNSSLGWLISEDTSDDTPVKLEASILVNGRDIATDALNYTWYFNNEKKADWSGKTINTNFGTIKNGAIIQFSATDETN